MERESGKRAGARIGEAVMAMHEDDMSGGQSNGLPVQESPSTPGNPQESLNWMTPRVMDASHLMMNEKFRGHQKESTLCGQAGNQSKRVRLNPDWVDALMGLKPGTTRIRNLEEHRELLEAIDALVQRTTFFSPSPEETRSSPSGFNSTSKKKP